ncbi:MAG: hypothetical protein MUF49_03105 [Oculatellaceae cyanobacterium Prado106]|jgi:hypothetical protein|nr:hypothetical protein [Oculatellaceae cyanobacterium Prado106]
MAYKTDRVHRQHPEGQAQSLNYALNRLMVEFSRVILTVILVNLVVQAFTLNVEAGWRSIAAIALPMLVVAYLAFANSSGKTEQQSTKLFRGFPSAIFYLIATVWMLALLILTRYVDAAINPAIPAGEFAISGTLSFYSAIIGLLPFKSLVACAYGIVSGVLLFILFFGV